MPVEECIATRERPAPAYWAAQEDGEIAEWTAADLLRAMAAEVPDVVALAEPPDPATGQRRQWTYAQLLSDSERAAQFLLLQFAPGDRIAIWAANQPEWAIVELGAALAGLVLVGINPASRANELEHALSLSAVRGIFMAGHFRGSDNAAVVEAMRARLPALEKVFLLDDWKTYAWPAPADYVPLPTVDPASVAMMQFTSGTTGRAKAAMLSHRGLVNIARFTETRFALDRGSVWLNWMPMFHTGGSVFALMGCMWNRGTHILVSGFDPVTIMRIVQEDRADWLPTVPTTALGMLDHPDRGKYDLSSLKIIVQGGTPVAPELVRRIERDLHVDYMMVFGQTETSSTICLSLRGDSDHHKTSTVGLPMPYTEVRIADPESGEILSHGEIGEIQVRSLAVMTGYFDQPDATAAALGADGWLHTGDLGTMEPDGYLTINGRLKDLIIRGGENIYPRETEDLLANHPAVTDVAVFGVPDARWGEKVVAAVRLRDGMTLTLADMQAFLAPQLARHKVPQDLAVIDDLPLTLSGKIQKFALRDAYLKTVGT